MIKNLNTLLQDQTILDIPFILKGLVKSSIGMLIASPGVGKSHLALSIAIEHASSATIVGLSCADTPKKVLIISAEDSDAVLRDRMAEKLKQLPHTIQNELLNNLFFISEQTPIVAPPDALFDEQQAIHFYVNNLVQSAINNNVDLIIVDTVSEAIGRCDEVKHDKHIKAAFQAIAKQTGAAILLVHHVNKNEIRGEQEITMASGAGLSSIMRLVKFLITIKLDKNARSVRFLKANYLPETEPKEFEIEFVGALLSKKSSLEDHHLTAKQDAKKRKLIQSIKEDPEIVRIKPEQSNKIDLRDIL